MRAEGRRLTFGTATVRESALPPRRNPVSSGVPAATTLEPQATPVPGTTGVTLAAYARMRQDGPLTELVRGEIVAVPFGSAGHGLRCSYVVAALAGRLPEVSRGRVLAGRVGFVTDESPATVRGPDVIVLPADRPLPAETPDGWLRGPAALVVEVRDRHETVADLRAKAVEYLRAGVGEVWALDGPTRQLRVHRDPSAEPLTLAESDELTSPQLPGFACKVADLLAVG